MENLLHITPYLAFSGGIGQGNLGWVGTFPPFLGVGVGRHFLHIGVKVIAHIFKIAKQVWLAVYLFYIAEWIIRIR